MKFIVFISVVLIAMILPTQADLTPSIYSTDCWEIPGPADSITWVQIHNSKEAEKSGVAHVEVLSRKKNSSAWEIKHVCGHIAITTEALQRSVTRPLKTRDVYPETFEEAYRHWKAASQKAPPLICTTSIQDFIKSNP